MNSTQELPAKAVMQMVSGRASTGPKDVLFVKWKENWELIKEQVTEEDPLNTYDWEASGSAQRNVALGIKQWAITFLQFYLLVSHSQRGFWVPERGPTGPQKATYLTKPSTSDCMLTLSDPCMLYIFRKLSSASSNLIKN